MHHSQLFSALLACNVDADVEAALKRLYCNLRAYVNARIFFEEDTRVSEDVQRLTNTTAGANGFGSAMLAKICKRLEMRSKIPLSAPSTTHSRKPSPLPSPLKLPSRRLQRPRLLNRPTPFAAYRPRIQSSRAN